MKTARLAACQIRREKMGCLFPLILLLAVGLVIYYIGRRPGGWFYPGSPYSNPENLQRRYERGEITREEYEQNLKDLNVD
jgi:uncharacterized membrane protein